MLGESPAALMLRNNRELLVPAAICAAACVFLMRMGLLSLFFLVPLGFSAAAYGAAVAWLALALAALGHGIWSAAASLGSGLGLAGLGMDMLHFAVLAAGFTWVMAGNPAGPALPRIRTFFRFAAASSAAALMLVGMTVWMGRGGFGELARGIEPLFSAFIAAAAGGDAVRQSVLEHSLAPEQVIEMAVALFLRGGALLSAAFLLFFSRQMSFLLARLFRKGAAGGGDLTGFFAPKKTIWLFSLSLPFVLLGRALGMQAVEIAAWNLLVMGGLAFFAQGGGVALFCLARRPLPLRILFVALFVAAALRPGLNLFALGALLVLGIAENWLQMRAAKRDAHL